MSCLWVVCSSNEDADLTALCKERDSAGAVGRGARDCSGDAGPQRGEGAARPEVKKEHDSLKTKFKRTNKVNILKVFLDYQLLC